MTGIIVAVLIVLALLAMGLRAFFYARRHDERNKRRRLK